MYTVVLAALKFGVSLFISAVLVVSGFALEKLVSLSIEAGSKPHQIVEFVLDVSLVGSAVVVAMCGAIIVAGEAIMSTKAFFSRNRG